MRNITVFLTIILAGATALAQQTVPPPPQPAPDKPVAANPSTASAPTAVQTAANPTAANGPTLEVTLKFIQDKVNEQGKIVYVESEINSLTGEKVEENASLGFAHRPAAAKASPSLARGPMKKGYAGAAGPPPEQYADTEVVAVNPAGILSIKETGTKDGSAEVGVGCGGGYGGLDKGLAGEFQERRKAGGDQLGGLQAPHESGDDVPG